MARKTNDPRVSQYLSTTVIASQAQRNMALSTAPKFSVRLQDLLKSPLFQSNEPRTVEQMADLLGRPSHLATVLCCTTGSRGRNRKKQEMQAVDITITDKTCILFLNLCFSLKVHSLISLYFVCSIFRLQYKWVDSRYDFLYFSDCKPMSHKAVLIVSGFDLH